MESTGIQPMVPEAAAAVQEEIRIPHKPQEMEGYMAAAADNSVSQTVQMEVQEHKVS